MNGPDKETLFPLKDYEKLCFLKNIVKNPQIIVGDYTYYDDFENVENFEKNVKYHSLLAKQIIFSAGSAWVFGGMWSWNDLGFESKEDNTIYDKLSEQLYSNIHEAIIAGTNSY